MSYIARNDVSYVTLERPVRHPELVSGSPFLPVILMQKKLSLCTPVHNTEKFFQTCLESLANQDFSSSSLKQSDIEYVIIDDMSTGRDGLGRTCKELVRDFKKSTKYKINFIQHKKDFPLLETRRQLVEEAHGQYILMIDSDDFLEKDALATLYNLITQNDADIAQGDAKEFFEKGGKITFKEEKTRIGKVFNGILQGDQILHSWIVEGKTSSFLWAKIIKRELYLEAFDKLIFSDCSLVGDLPLYFHMALVAQKYAGTDKVVYNYRVDSGVTSNPTVKDLVQWKKICSIASGLTNLASWIENETLRLGKSPISLEEKAGLQRHILNQLHTSVIQLQKFVSDDIKTEAREMLCEYWGESFVEYMEKSVENEK